MNNIIYRRQKQSYKLEMLLELFITANVFTAAAADILAIPISKLTPLFEVSAVLFLFLLFGYYIAKGNYTVLIKREKRQKNILIVGQNETGRELSEKSKAGITRRTNIVGIVLPAGDVDEESEINNEIIGSTNNLESIIRFYAIDEVFICHDSNDIESLFVLIDRCRKINVKINLSSKEFRVLGKKIKCRKHYGIPFVDFSLHGRRYLSMKIKRVIDIALASAAIITLFPLFLVIAILVKATSPGPVFFRQLRVGLNGKHFWIYKFRSMYELKGEDEERKTMMINFMKSAAASGSTKVVNHQRITRFGSLLRKTSLDEFPQLINVLKGEMSLVGPRPELPYEHENYETWQKRRVNLYPGCTGLWQVTGRSAVSFKDSIILDIYYTYNVSPWLDLKIMLKTFPVIILSRGGE